MIIILMDDCNINGDTCAFPLRYLTVGLEKILMLYQNMYPLFSPVRMTLCV